MVCSVGCETLRYHALCCPVSALLLIFVDMCYGRSGRGFVRRLRTWAKLHATSSHATLMHSLLASITSLRKSSGTKCRRTSDSLHSFFTANLSVLWTQVLRHCQLAAGRGTWHGKMSCSNLHNRQLSLNIRMFSSCPASLANPPFYKTTQCTSGKVYKAKWFSSTHNNNHRFLHDRPTVDDDCSSVWSFQSQHKFDVSYHNGCENDDCQFTIVIVTLLQTKSAHWTIITIFWHHAWTYLSWEIFSVIGTVPQNILATVQHFVGQTSMQLSCACV